MRAVHFVRSCAFVVAVATFGAPARAQSAGDKAAAEALFDQGRAAMQEGDFAKACGLLERSQQTDPGIGTLLYLGECYEKSGRTASAWATFREAADTAAAAQKGDRARTGRERAARLEPLLSRLTIQIAVDAQVPGLTIERSGRPVQQALWNVPVPVDPAEYRVSASAPGYEPWTQAVIVPERAAKVSIVVPGLRKAPESDKAQPAAPTSGDLSKTSPPPPPAGSPMLPPPAPESGGGGKQRTAAYLVGGAGIIGIGIGAVFGIQAISKNSEAKTNCPNSPVCDNTTGPELTEDAKGAARVANVAFAIGGAALVGGAVLLLTSPKQAEGPSVRAAIGPTGATLWGAF